MWIKFAYIMIEEKTSEPQKTTNFHYCPQNPLGYNMFWLQFQYNIHVGSNPLPTKNVCTCFGAICRAMSFSNQQIGQKNDYFNSLPSESHHASESYGPTNYAYEDEDEYTKIPIVKIIATFQKRTTASYEPHSIVPETKIFSNMPQVIHDPTRITNFPNDSFINIIWLFPVLCLLGLVPNSVPLCRSPSYIQGCMVKFNTNMIFTFSE